MGRLRIILPMLCLAMVAGAPGAGRAEDLFGPPPSQQTVVVKAGSEGRVEGRTPGAASVLEVPLTALTATRLRPLFSPSRRPPAASARTTPVAAPAPAAPPPPARPRIVLLGTVTGESVSYGLFRAEPSGTVMRLRLGETYEGWLLRAVGGRDATLEKGRETAILTLPKPAPAAQAARSPGRGSAPGDVPATGGGHR